jgi:hypothetical protein
MIDYAELIQLAPMRDSYESIVGFLVAELPHVWFEEYASVSARPTNVVRLTLGGFNYLFDLYTEFEVKGVINEDAGKESRLVAVFGQSAAKAGNRESSRLRGWIGPTAMYLGNDWDKGHFIAHAMGGGVDGAEINLFVQRRNLNRGWSAPGKMFRSMEVYAAKRPGTFCFHRPLYADGTSRPSQFEFGVLKADGALWVETFDN